MNRPSTALALALLLLSSCADPSADPSDPSPNVSANPSDRSPEPSPTTAPTSAAAPSTDPVSRARDDLAGRLGVAAELVEVVTAEEVTWPDGSLGCPREGMFYTQATVSGSRIVLQVDGVRYAYHSAAGRAPFLCEDPTPPVAPGTAR